MRTVSSLLTPGALGFQAKTCDSTTGAVLVGSAEELARRVAGGPALVVQRPLVRGEAVRDVRRLQVAEHLADGAARAGWRR